MYTDADLNTYPPNIVDILGIVTTPIIFFHPFKLMAVTTNAVFTIEPIISCEFVAITLVAPNTLFNISPKNVGTNSAIKNISIVWIVSVAFEKSVILLFIMLSFSILILLSFLFYYSNKTFLLQWFLLIMNTCVS